MEDCEDEASSRLVMLPFRAYAPLFTSHAMSMQVR